MINRRARAVATAGMLLAVSACASHPVPPSPALAPVATGAPARNDLHWFRSSAEYRGIAIETYRAAAARLPELSRGLAAGSWGVILDADETVLDNSLHERQLADRHESFSEAEWSRWVREGRAAAIPGAVDFTARVHALGGRIVIVTNRADSLCGPTRENLRHIGVDADVVLCQPGSESNKNPRFARVHDGTAATGVPALNVVEWIGDNILDFPGLSQSVRGMPDGYRDFGVRFFLLPNPIYGSWLRNTEP